MAVAELVLVLLSPTLLFGALIGTGRLARHLRRVREERRDLPAGPPLERVAADARRLRWQLLRAEDAPGGDPGRGVRVSALRAAYADVLRTAGGLLDVAVPARLSPAETFRVESELRDRGLDVYGRPA